MEMDVHLVLVRHGKSTWTQSGRFTGWADVPISESGKTQAAHAGERLAHAGIRFDEVHSSVMQRTLDTAQILLVAANQSDIPHHSTWRLNERHYGQLQGMDKHEIFFGVELFCLSTPLGWATCWPPSFVFHPLSAAESRRWVREF